MKCKCRYYLRDSEGKLVCSVCGKPAHENGQVEDKMQGKHEDKAPLYISDKDMEEAEKSGFQNQGK